MIPAKPPRASLHRHPAPLGEITLATFDGAPHTTRFWRAENDAVLTGTSKAAKMVDTVDKVLIFSGQCLYVPRIQFPGYIKVTSLGELPDVHRCKNLVLNVKSTQEYQGFRVSFASNRYPRGRPVASGFKSNFKAPTGSFQDVVIPWSMFSDNWDPVTGEPITVCHHDWKACPSRSVLANINSLSIWAEGVSGNVTLLVKNVRATGCNFTAPDYNQNPFLPPPRR